MFMWVLPIFFISDDEEEFDQEEDVWWRRRGPMIFVFLGSQILAASRDLSMLICVCVCVAKVRSRLDLVLQKSDPVTGNFFHVIIKY